VTPPRSVRWEQGRRAVVPGRGYWRVRDDWTEVHRAGQVVAWRGRVIEALQGLLIDVQPGAAFALRVEVVTVPPAVLTVPRWATYKPTWADVAHNVEQAIRLAYPDPAAMGAVASFYIARTSSPEGDPEPERLEIEVARCGMVADYLPPWLQPTALL